MVKENEIDIDALELDDETIKWLCMARWYGFLTNGSVLDHFADGGAQLIRSFGKRTVRQVYPHGLHFKLSSADKAEMDRVLSSPELRAKPDYSSEDLR